MKNLSIKTIKTVESYLVIPEYFRINHGQYFRIVSNDSYVMVTYYNTTKDEMESLTVYPEIQVRKVDQLYIYVQNRDIIEITKDEFIKQFDACTNFIDTLWKPKIHKTH